MKMDDATSPLLAMIPRNIPSWVLLLCRNTDHLVPGVAHPGAVLTYHFACLNALRELNIYQQ